MGINKFVLINILIIFAPTLDQPLARTVNVALIKP
jgi:hypothetical protein